MCSSNRPVNAPSDTANVLNGSAHVDFVKITSLTSSGCEPTRRNRFACDTTAAPALWPSSDSSAVTATTCTRRIASFVGVTLTSPSSAKCTHIFSVASTGSSTASVAEASVTAACATAVALSQGAVSGTR